jgi:hypothetical protein
MIGRYPRWFAAAAFAAVLALPARAADIDHWSLCMGEGGHSAAIKECTAIIDSKKELTDSLPSA